MCIRDSIDTVGLVRRLPHQLVEAFQSTLEEAADADLLLHVCDISSPEADDQIEVTRRLLDELGCTGTPVVTALNKCDQLESMPVIMGSGTVLISARTGYGLNRLLDVYKRQPGALGGKREKVTITIKKPGFQNPGFFFCFFKPTCGKTPFGRCV